MVKQHFDRRIVDSYNLIVTRVTQVAILSSFVPHSYWVIHRDFYIFNFFFGQNLFSHF